MLKTTLKVNSLLCLPLSTQLKVYPVVGSSVLSPAACTSCDAVEAMIVAAHSNAAVETCIDLRA